MTSQEFTAGGTQEKVQKFGRFLSGMVMPNIGAFIAWGLITALFIPTGWMPNCCCSPFLSLPCPRHLPKPAPMFCRITA